MMELPRIMVFDRLDAYVCDLDPARIQELRSVEEINGEHALTITATHQLDKTNRIVLNDGMGIWHEYVVTGIVDTHETDQGIVTEYYCVWSIQYDLSCTFVNDQYGCGIVPGHASVMHPAVDGLTIALSTTNRWQIGTITVTSEAAASFYRKSGWEAIQTVIEKWGGELQATITVGQDGVVSRAVDLLAHVGASVATRRFDYGHDVASIKRTVSEDVWPCRIVPLGASQETDEGGYTRRPTIESVNDGVIWLQDDTAAPYTRVPDGNGGWEYPTMIVENDTYEEPADLKAWALANITDYTRPKVSYEASVVQLARAGMNAHGVALGDEVVIVDREFGGEGLRISARVVKQECNLLDPSDTVLTIGNATDKLSSQFADLSRQVGEVAAQVSNASAYQSTAAYLSRLLERLNAEANATGGFAYITEGQGIRTYDVAVTDPLVGAEAHAVVEVKGGTIRIANTKTSAGEWEWKTVFTSGYVNAEVIRAIGMLMASHVEVDALGVHVYDADGTEVALFAATPRIGETDGYNVTIEPSSVDFNKGTSKVYGITAYAETVDGEYTTVTTNRGTLEYGADGGALIEGEEVYYDEKESTLESWDNKLTLKTLNNHKPDGAPDAGRLEHGPYIELVTHCWTSSSSNYSSDGITFKTETYVIWDLQNTFRGTVDPRSYPIECHDVAIGLRHPEGSYTGANTTNTATANGWRLTYFNTRLASVGSPGLDFHFDNGVIQPTRDICVEISGVMHWRDTVAGQRGFGIFSSATPGSGTEYSVFQNWAASSSAEHKSVVFPPRTFNMLAGDKWSVGRYEPKDAIYTNGTNMSWITIKVIG